jgi:hypothetical protein
VISCDLSKFTGIEDDDPLMNSNNIVILPKPSAPEGIRVLNVLRFNSLLLSNLSIILESNQTTNNLSFISIIKFPGGMTKFAIRYDPVTETYFSFVNPVIKHIKEMF